MSTEGSRTWHHEPASPVLVTYVKFLEGFGYRCHTIADDGTVAPVSDVKSFFLSKEFLKSPVINVVFKVA
jgi:hypothetical protein